MKDFKLELERLCKIIDWDPSEYDLKRIAQEIEKIERTRQIELSEIKEIVSRVVPNASFMMLEGVDYSDIRTLLAMAIKATKGK